MNWDELRFFLAVANLGTLSAAARALQVSQATVWRKIYSLEQMLNVRLFDASRSGYTMTAAGLQLIPLAEQMALTASEIKVAVQEGAELTGSVRLSAPEILATQLVTEIICPLNKAHPSLNVELFTASPLASLVARDTDIAILVNKSTQEHHVCLAEYTLPFALYGTSEYLAQKKQHHIIGLQDHLLIDFEESGEHLSPSGWYKKSAGMIRVFRSNSPNARLTAAKNNMGLALLPCCYVKKEKGLVKVINEKEIGELTVYLYLNKKRERLPYVVELRQRLKVNLRRLLLG
ncbi:LysR family transcriptional regulator [Spartinivicinus poritis]|uniref:LysR family transcriptional regulator n=1 Tax=Spartinivicinus poritis TaxID=2994640 RepID=A0ABT5UEV8_9GAMM|nr:LysR family transcriptional regulator [Spartinivicinus sp. A2-2]MDE1464920.1 LysR family transcriptional regulator [Spartinivicinus sp. A2-2]